MTEFLWLYLAVLVLAPILGWVGRRLFRVPEITLAADPGPLIDAVPTTIGATAALARLHTVTVLAAGAVLLPALAVVLGLVPVGILAGMSGHEVPRLSLASLVALYIVLAAAGLSVSWRVRSRARRAGALQFEVYRDRLRVPTGSLLNGHLTLPLASLRSVDAPPNGCLVIDTIGDTYVLRPQTFPGPSSASRLRDAIVGQLALLPEGADVLARSRQEAEVLREYGQRAARVTSAAVASCVVVFVVEILVGLGNNALFRMGANVRPLTWGGDWYRLFTASFLHVGFWHLVFNISFISTFGGVVERTVGPARFLVIYLSSGVTGAAVGSRFDFMSAGASTAAFGLMGALAVLQYRYGHVLPAGYRLHPGRWVVLLGVNAALPFLFPNISWAGHVGGLVGGALACAVVARTPDALAGGDAPNGVRGAAALLVAAHLCSFVLAARYASSGADFETELFEALAADPGAAPAQLNNLAWSIAVDRSAPAARLRAAVRLAERAAARGGPEATDTLAQALHRVGNDDEAVRREARLVLESGKPVYATQLVRFLAARRQRGKGALAEPEVAAIEPRVVLPPSAQDPARLVIELPVPVPRTLVLYLVGHPGGLLEVCIGAGPAGAREARVVGKDVPAAGRFELGYAGTLECPAGRARFFAAADPSVSRLP